METIETAAVLLYQNTQVLLVEYQEKSKHKIGVVGFTGGRLKPGESFLDAAVRELEEESGLIVDPLDLIEIPTIYEAKITRKDGTIRKYVMRAYVGTLWQGTLRDSAETKPVWTAISEVGKKECTPNIERVVNDGLALLNLGSR